MRQVGTAEVENGIGILTIDHPPVNALSIAARRALEDGFRGFAEDGSVRAVVLICAGRTFFAGADISEFGNPTQQPDFARVFAAVEECGKPVVAAIHGTALGGGYELALVCDYRIAVPSAQVGLPEVSLGLMPGAGGTQRLPRIVGVEAALDIMAGGKPVRAPRALELGMIDALAEEGRLRADAIAFARRVLDEGRPRQRLRDREDKIAPARGHPEIYAEYIEKNASKFRGFKAPFNIVKAVEAAAELSFEEGLACEQELFSELLDSTESAAQRYYFFAEREAAKVPELPAETAPRPLSRVGIVGAGTMGSGIAMNFLEAGIPVTLVETTQPALDRGLGMIRRTLATAAAKGRMSEEQVEARVELVRPTLELAALADADLIIEAVFEDMAVKTRIFGELDRIARPGAVLASNTSFLDLNEIAAATSRPQDVIGLHFFSPANVMRLLEVVRGAKTADDVLATALNLAKTIRKVPVVSGVCHGFIANRVMSNRGRTADRLVLEGPTPEAIDRALVDFGFTVGHFQMMDMVGLDVLARGDERSVDGELVALGRLGQKQGGGYYDYDDRRRPTPSPVAAELIARFAAELGVEKGPELTPDEIIARLLYPVVNEGARVLEEGIAIRASDIDVACVLGYNWPVYTGGPMFWGHTVGLGRVIDGLRSAGIEPAPLLLEVAASNGRLSG